MNTVIAETISHKCSAVAEMGDRLATIDMGRKSEAVPHFGGELGPHVPQCGPRPTFVPSGILIHPAVCAQYTWAENRGLCPLFRGGELGPYLTQCRLGQGLPFYQVTS